MQQAEQGPNRECLDSLPCPSFNCYSSDQLASIADQVGRDYNRVLNDDAFYPGQNDDLDFEFVAFPEAAHDGVFLDDAVFPLFKRDLLRDHRSIDTTAAALHRSEFDPPSESSSEGDDLEGVPAGTYCVWTPNSPQASPSTCKKSNSTGSSSSSSKRWKLLDLLRRSNSDGKESLVFLTPSPGKNKAKEQWRIEAAGKLKTKGFTAGDSRDKKDSALASAREASYVRNRELRRIDKKRSFLPYKTDLIGFCTTRLGRAEHFA